MIKVYAEIMTANCQCLAEGKPLERNGHTASCNREQRKLERESLKPPKTKKPIDKVGKKNTFECSDGERVTQAQINYRLDKAYDEAEYDCFYCYGCGCYPADGHAHIVPKARCKQLNKTELIWLKVNFFPACNKCNSICENVSSPAIMQLNNYQIIKHVLELFDFERFTKLPDYSIANEPHIL